MILFSILTPELFSVCKLCCFVWWSCFFNFGVSNES